MSILVENTINEITYAGGINTNKPTNFGGSNTFTGTSNFTGTTNINLGLDLNPTKTPFNTTGTATAAQIATGYITSTTAAAVTMTMPTGTLLGTALGATQGSIFELYIDNTAGANTFTVAVAVNGILSDAANTTAASFGQLTVASGVTGIGRFTIMFASATAYVFTRTA